MTPVAREAELRFWRRMVNAPLSAPNAGIVVLASNAECAGAPKAELRGWRQRLNGVLGAECRIALLASEAECAPGAEG